MRGATPARPTAAFVVVFATAVLATGPDQRPPDQPRTAGAGRIDPFFDRAASELRDVIERYVTDRNALSRRWSIQSSPARLQRFEAFHRQWLARLEAIAFETLGTDGRIDYLLFRNQLGHELRTLAHTRARIDEMSALLPFAQTIIDLEEARRAFEFASGPAAAETLHTLLTAIQARRQEVTAALDKTRDPGSVARRHVANRAVRTLNELRTALAGWGSFYFGYDPEFTWWVREPYDKVVAALDDYAAFLRRSVVGLEPGDEDAVVGDPIGREALLSELAYEMIPYTPEELIRIAERELAWSERELLRASRDLGFGDDWRAAQEHVKKLYVEPGRQPHLVRDLAREAIEFVESRDLVTIPELAKEIWRMEMLSPERQRFAPFFLGGERVQVAFPTDTMSHRAKTMSMRGNNRHFSRNAVQHELIPGHHLQLFMAERYRPYRSLFRTAFLVEGWALYWELLLWDMGFPQSPEDRIGMLFWRMHRSARVIFSLGFHLHQMTPEEAIDLLVTRIGFEPANAEAEVRRSFEDAYGPLFQAAYLIGGLQIRALRRELVDTKRLPEKTFHDRALQENAIPIELVRASLTGETLSRDFTTRWRFYQQP